MKSVLWKGVFHRFLQIKTLCVFLCSVVALTTRPDGNEVAVATLDGQLTFWDIGTAIQLHCIEGRNDLGGGRKNSDRMTAKTSSASKYVYRLYFKKDIPYHSSSSLLK